MLSASNSLPDSAAHDVAPTMPTVLRSWQHLRDHTPGMAIPDKLPLTPSGATYTMAQELTWLDEQHFAVGRWDGSLSIFQFTRATTQGPLMSTVANTPSAEGVQMICLISDGRFATSNDEQSALVWQRQGASWMNVQVSQRLPFPHEFGVANAAASIVNQELGQIYFVMGHANGFLSIWRESLNGSDTLNMFASLNLRSATPTNPWHLHHIRGIAVLAKKDANQADHIVTGSEDGDLCIVRLQDASIVARTAYNPAAQRGINSLAVSGNRLLVANCAVGETDKNLWLFEIDNANWQINYVDAARLVVDQQLAQVFDFDVIWGRYSEGPCWYAATEEGYLWMGNLDSKGKLHVIAHQAVTTKLGAAIGQSENGDLAFAAYDLYEFDAMHKPST